MIARAPRLVKHKSSSPPLPARMRAGSGGAELIPHCRAKAAARSTTGQLSMEENR